MNFLEALKSGRPMRRLAWRGEIAKAVTTIVAKEMMLRHLWIYCSVVEGPDGASMWIRLSDGKRHSVMPWDYEALDWEIMPMSPNPTLIEN